MEDLIQNINLAQYIRHGLFLNNIKLNNFYDLIIFEKFENDELKKSLSLNIETLEGLKYDFSMTGAVAGIINKYNNILIVLDKLNINYLLPIIQSNNKISISIINIGTGISGLLNKPCAENNDLGLIMNYQYKVYEPFDVNSFFKMMLVKKNKYIRIAHKEIPLNINFDNGFDILDGTISLTENNLTSDLGTILVPGYMLSEGLQMLGMFQQEDQHYDAFLIYDYDFLFNHEIQESIRKTEKLIIVLDQVDSYFEHIIKSKLWEKGLFDTQILLIKPSFDNIKTNLPEYLFENAKFDGKGLYEKI